MNFKGFLKKTGFLNEDGDPTKQDIDNFKKNAYKRVFKYRGSKANEQDPDKCWRAVLNKARYKLTQNSNDDNRNAVKIAKGAIATAKARFKDAISDKLTADEEKEFAKNTTDKIRNHAEDWTQKDVEELKKKLQSNSKFDQENIQYLTIFNLQKGKGDDTFLDGLSEEQQKELFEAMKELESDEGLDEKVWKDKTIEDLDELNDDDIAKIKGELEKKGIEITDKKDIEKLIKDGTLKPEDIETLDNLLNTESTPPAEPNKVPNGSTPPETENRDKQNQMQEMEKKRKLEKKLKDNDIPVKEDGTPDFDNPKTLEKINELMINGDDELYNEYVLTKGGTQSDLAKMITDRQAKENELARTDLENRMARHEAEKDQQKAICNVALALDIFFAFFSGKVQDGFSTLANKRVQAAALSKQFDEGLNKDAFAKEDEKIENAHNKELDSIKTWEAQRMAEIEQDRQTPMGTQTYKRKYADLIKEKENKKQDFKNRKDAYMPKVDRKEKIDKFLFSLDTSAQIDTNNPAIQELFPKKDGETPEDYAARLQTETSDPVKLKEKLQAESDEIQQTVENFNTEEKQIEADFNKAAKDLENDPDVQSEFKDANAAYEFKKANIQAEMNVLRAKEQKRYEDRKSVNKQVFEERRRVLKNIATMGQWSSDPDSVFATEMQAFNRRAKELYESRGIPWNEDNDPLMSDNPDVLKQAMADYKESLKQSEKQQQEQGKGKKTDETGGKKPQRQPLGGRKPEPDPDPEKKKTKPGEGQKQLESLKGKFNGKPLAQKRLDTFLKEKDLDPEDPDYDTDLQNAIKEFNSKTFPKPEDLSENKLKELGLSPENIPDDAKDENNNKITTLEGYAKYLQKESNAEALKKLKEELGFEETGGVTNKTPIEAPDNFEGISNLGLTGTITVGNENIDLSTLTKEQFEQIKADPEAWKKLKEQLKSVNALKAISKNGKFDPEEEKKEWQNLEDGENDKGNSIKAKSLKALWQMLNNAGISIRALPGYQSGWKEEDKKNALVKYIQDHRVNFAKPGEILADSVNLNHRKTAFKRLNEMSQAQKRASDRRTLRKFSELLVKDFRDFT